TGQGEVNPLSDTITMAITDDTADSDATPGQIVISIVDDIPVPVVADSASLANVLGAIGTFDLDVDDNVDDNLGADGRGGVIFYSDGTLTDDTIDILEAQNLTSGLAPLEYDIQNGGTLLIATKSTDNSEVFRIELEPTGNEDQYVVTVSQKVDATTDVDFNDGGYNFVGGNTSWAGFTVPGDNDSQDLLLSPVNGGSVNTNANEGGVDNNNVGSGEAMRVDYVIDLVGTPVSGGDFYGGDDTQNFDGHYTINGGSAYFTQITSSTTVTIAAFDDDDSGTVKDVGDGAPDAITAIAISFNSVTSAQIVADGTYNVGGNNFTVTFNGDGTVNVAGVPSDTRIAAYTVDGYNSVEWGHGGGNTFKIGDFGASVVTDDPISFDVPIYVVDGDGDRVSSGNLAITLNPIEPVVALDLDGDGVEFLGTDAGIMYDLNGDAVVENVAWVGPDDGFLVIDANSNGAVDSASEIVFDNGSNNAFEFLAALAASGDANALDPADAIWLQLGVWQDADSDGVFDAGEFFTMADLGITSISIVDDSVRFADANGEVVVHGSAEFVTDGSGTLAAGSFDVVNAQVDPVNQASNDNPANDEDAVMAMLSHGTGQFDGRPVSILESRLSDSFIVSAAMAGFMAGMPVQGVAAASSTQFISSMSSFTPPSLAGVDMPALIESYGMVAGDGNLLGVSSLSAWASGDAHTTNFRSAIEQGLSNPLSHSNGESSISASELAAAEPAIEAAAISFDGQDMVGSSLMEALLIMGGADGPTRQSDAMDLLAAEEVMADVLAERMVDALVEQFADHSAAGHADAAEAVVEQMSAFLGFDVTGTAGLMTFGVNDVSVDDGADHVLLHG
ncbi:hypothetical protein AAEO60_03050, partial [Aurantiacibacter sp. DGU6]